jgi:FKBP-type peptidyl-prolyl cis-trans isomerase
LKETDIAVESFIFATCHPEPTKNKIMKKIFTVSLSLFAAIFIVQAQKTTTGTKTGKTTPVKVQPPQPALKNLEDSAMYAIGVSVGTAYKNDGLKKINETLVARGINEVMSGQKLLLDDMQANNCIMSHLKSLKAKTAAPKPVPKKIEVDNAILKSTEDSVSYAIGMSVANFYRIQGLQTINTSLVVKTVNNILTGKPAKLNDQQMMTVINEYLNRMQVWKSKPNIIAGEQFLEKNKTKPGVITTATGLQYEVITQGTGPKLAAADTFVCHYRGMFLNGNVFDESYSRKQPLVYAVTDVIKGWTEALLLMPVGSKYKLYVPYALGYGINDYFAIPGGSLLIFEIELLDIKKKQ